MALRKFADTAGGIKRTGSPARKESQHMSNEQIRKTIERSYDESKEECLRSTVRDFRETRPAFERVGSGGLAPGAASLAE
jgi:hypothetical protein